MGKSATAYQCFQFVHAWCKDTGQDSLTRLSLTRVLENTGFVPQAPSPRGRVTKSPPLVALLVTIWSTACTLQTAVEMLAIRLRNLRGTTSWPCSRLVRNACRRSSQTYLSCHSGPGDAVVMSLLRWLLLILHCGPEPSHSGCFTPSWNLALPGAENLSPPLPQAETRHVLRLIEHDSVSWNEGNVEKRRVLFFFLLAQGKLGGGRH